MTSDLVNLFRGSPLIKKAIDLFLRMIDSDGYLYDEAWRVITSDEEVDHIPQYFYDKDITVNNEEKEIRRLLFEHLSIHPGHDVSGCLALMSLVKDAERIGDYSKNIFEAGILYGGRIQNMKFYARLTPTQNRLSKSFPVLREAFKHSDIKLAGGILNQYKTIKVDCDKVLHELLKEDLSTNEAVVTAMLSRYLKRINSHISNIASGIVYPLNEIDFVTGDILE